MCYDQSATFTNTNGWLLPVIHAVYEAYQRFYQLKLKITGNYHCNSLYLGLQIPENILSDLFSCCDSIATIPVPSFLLLHVFLRLQRHLRPISPAKMTETKLWTLITFFWGWVVLHHIAPNVLDIGKDHLSKVCSFF